MDNINLKNLLKMQHLNTAKASIDKEISLLETRLNSCKIIQQELDKIILNENSENLIAEKINGNEFNIEEYKDYPLNKRLFEKLHYLDQKFPKAWLMRDRLELIIKIEGENARERLEKYMSNDLKSYIKSGIYIGAKYANINKLQFYVRPEWMEKDGKSIMIEHAPNEKDLGNLPEYKRKSEMIVWMTNN